MNKETIFNYLFGTVTVEFLIAFYIFALIGVTLSMLFHYKKKQTRDKKVNNKKRFNKWFWVKDNIVRLFTSIICIFVMVRFYDELPIDYELNMFLGVLTGTGIDQLIIFIRNRTTIDIFQTKSYQ